MLSHRCSIVPLLSLPVYFRIRPRFSLVTAAGDSGHPTDYRSPNTSLFLAIIARGVHPFPFRTRQLSPVAPMVLRARPRESRSSPGFFISLPFLSKTLSKTLSRTLSRTSPGVRINYSSSVSFKLGYTSSSRGRHTSQIRRHSGQLLRKKSTRTTRHPDLFLT